MGNVNESHRIHLSVLIGCVVMLVGRVDAHTLCHVVWGPHPPGPPLKPPVQTRAQWENERQLFGVVEGMLGR